VKAWTSPCLVVWRQALLSTASLFPSLRICPGTSLSRSPFSEGRVDRTNGRPGTSWKRVQIKGRSPRLVVGSSTISTLESGRQNNEWRDLELQFVKTSYKIRKGCLVAAVVPSRHATH